MKEKSRMMANKAMITLRPAFVLVFASILPSPASDVQDNSVPRCAESGTSETWRVSPVRTWAGRLPVCRFRSL
jgi:hypothetical protein